MGPNVMTSMASTLNNSKSSSLNVNNLYSNANKTNTATATATAAAAAAATNNLNLTGTNTTATAAANQANLLSNLGNLSSLNPYALNSYVTANNSAATAIAAQNLNLFGGFGGFPGHHFPQQGGLTRDQLAQFAKQDYSEGSTRRGTLQLWQFLVALLEEPS